MEKKKNDKKVFVAAILVIAVIGGLATGAIFVNKNNKSKDKDTYIAKSSEVIKNDNSSSSFEKDKNDSSSNTETNDSTISNDKPKTETANQDRGAVKTEGSATDAEIADAAKEGEHKQKVYDVKLKSGENVSEQDIANARKAIKDAGLQDEAYSDYDIAEIVKAASDKSLDIATIAKDGKW